MADTLNAQNDAYVKFDDGSGTNFNDSDLGTKNSGLTNFNRRTWIQFDVSGYSGVSSAVLELTANNEWSGPANPNETIDLDLFSDLSWGETTLTYDNAPAEYQSSESTYDDIPSGFNAGSTTSWDVTSIVDTAISNGASTITFVLWDESANDKNYESASKENGTYSGPKLVVEPETGAITASITEGAQAGDSMSVTARLTAAMTEAAQSGDTLGSTGQLVEALTEGAQSGETWASTLLAAASVDEGAVSSEDFVATVLGGIQASLDEGSTAAESFVDALIARASLAEGATAAEEFVNALIADADVQEGATAGESLSATVSTPALTAAINEAAEAGDSWVAASTLAASISEGAEATDDMTPITAARWLEATIRVAAKLAGSADTDSKLDGTPNIDPND